MKVVYPICCGVDVHKTFLVATLITSEGITPQYSKKRFSTFNKSILKFKQWLIENNCFDICMESTGKYYIPVYNHRKLDEMVAPFENGIRLLCTIPGVDRNSAITIISEIGMDMSQFARSKKLCCWAGLTPGSNESAGKKKSVRITRAGVYLKPALVQVAHASVMSNQSPYYQDKYQHICKRRGKKKAIIAVARMILTAIYHIFATGEEWNPSDLYKIDMPQEMLERQKQKAVKQAVNLLISQGIIKASYISLA